MNSAAIRDHARRIIDKERARQDNKWGVQDHPDIVWHIILSEETGEAAKEILEILATDKSDEELFNEIVQIAAVALAWLECKLRKKTEKERGC